MEPLQPLLTHSRFPSLYRELLTLLRGLSPDDWTRQTSAPLWKVRDVVAHLVDIDLRKLATSRDGHLPPPDVPIGSWADLVGFLNGFNAEWVRAARRLSPRLLIELVEFTGPRIAELAAALPPFERSVFPVDWAGERESQNWMDMGRELVERWHHQMQIREAVGAEGLTSREWLEPVLDLSVRSLARAYQGMAAPEGTAVVVNVTGDGGGTWSVRRAGDAWRVEGGRAEPAAASVTLDADAAWRAFLHDTGPARARARIVGNGALAEPFFLARALMV